MQPRHILTEKAFIDMTSGNSKIWRYLCKNFTRKQLTLLLVENNYYTFCGDDIKIFLKNNGSALTCILPKSALEIINKEEYLASTIF